jgi:hypothetical protein
MIQGQACLLDIRIKRDISLLDFLRFPPESCGGKGPLAQFGYFSLGCHITYLLTRLLDFHSFILRPYIYTQMTSVPALAIIVNSIASSLLNQ